MCSKDGFIKEKPERPMHEVVCSLCCSCDLKHDEVMGTWDFCHRKLQARYGAARDAAIGNARKGHSSPDDVATNSDAGHGIIGFHVHLAGFYSDLVSSFLARSSFFLLEWECLLCAFVHRKCTTPRLHPQPPVCPPGHSLLRVWQKSLDFRTVSELRWRRDSRSCPECYDPVRDAGTGRVTEALGTVDLASRGRRGLEEAFASSCGLSCLPSAAMWAAISCSDCHGSGWIQWYLWTLRQNKSSSCCFFRWKLVTSNERNPQ